MDLFEPNCINMYWPFASRKTFLLLNLWQERHAGAPVCHISCCKQEVSSPPESTKTQGGQEKRGQRARPLAALVINLLPAGSKKGQRYSYQNRRFLLIK